MRFALKWVQLLVGPDFSEADTQSNSGNGSKVRKAAIGTVESGWRQRQHVRRYTDTVALRSETETGAILDGRFPMNVFPLPCSKRAFREFMR